MHTWFNRRIIQKSSLVTAIRKRPRDTDGTDCIQSICILYHFSFKSRSFCLYSCPLKTNFRDYLLYALNYFWCHLMRHQHLSCYTRTNRVVTSVKFPIGNIMQKRSKFNYKHICLLFSSNMLCHLPHPINVPPIVASPLSTKFPLHFTRYHRNQILFVHKTSIAKFIEHKSPAFRRGFC